MKMKSIVTSALCGALILGNAYGASALDENIDTKSNEDSNGTYIEESISDSKPTTTKEEDQTESKLSEEEQNQQNPEENKDKQEENKDKQEEDKEAQQNPEYKKDNEDEQNQQDDLDTPEENDINLDEENDIFLLDENKISSNIDVPDDEALGVERDLGTAPLIYNPSVKYNKLKNAEQKVGFKINVPNIKQYNKKTYYVVGNKTLEIDYSNGKTNIIVRKAKGNKNISGDSSFSKVNKVIKVNGIKVKVKYNKKNQVRTAVWQSGKYTYSITTNSKDGIKEANIVKMIKNIK